MLSNVERDFVRAALSEHLRIDGRNARDYRPTSITYEGSRGCCFVNIGETKVMSQVSWELSSPKESRPNEGILKINVELSPIIGSFASVPYSQPSTAQVVELNRLLERILRESHCLDLESLCIESGVKVITIKIDLHVLNHSGNLVDTLVLAGIGAMKHFRRPTVTYCGLEATVHTSENQDPQPLNLLHIPISTTFAFFSLTNEHVVILMDPNDLEEKCCDWKITIAANKHREICMMQTLGSKALTTVEQIILCCNLAIQRAMEANGLIEKSIKNYEEGVKTLKSYSGVCMVMEEDLAKMDIKVNKIQESGDETVTNDANDDNVKSQEIKVKTPKIEKDLKIIDNEKKSSEIKTSEPNNNKMKKKKRKNVSHTITNVRPIGTGGQSAWDDHDGT